MEQFAFSSNIHQRPNQQDFHPLTSVNISSESSYSDDDAVVPCWISLDWTFLQTDAVSCCDVIRLLTRAAAAAVSQMTQKLTVCLSSVI